MSPYWVGQFNRFYFAPDNPWNVHSQALHKLGTVRTNERLDDYTRDPGVLYRSSYYNEWMQPQGFRYSLGNTLTTDRSGIANVTLLRAPDLPTFNAREVKDFERLNGHLLRALRIRECLGEARLRRDLLADALDEIEAGMLLVSPEGRLVHGNRAGLQRLARGDGLVYREGRVQSAHAPQQAALEMHLRSHAPQNVLNAAPRECLLLQRSVGAQPLRVNAVGLSLPMSSKQAERACVLLILSTPGGSPAEAPMGWLRQTYGLTEAEARLAQSLHGGLRLHEAAEHLGVTYGTARTRLKFVFAKMGVRRQAELLTRIARDLGPPVAGA